jgi:DNA-binding transcriptional regulator YiaG
MKMAKHSKLGKELIQSLEEVVVAAERGELHKLTVRTLCPPPPPTAYDAHAVRTARERLGVSQAIFAAIMGVSTVLVQSWEQGVLKPSRMACRLLDEITANPGRWRRLIRAA